MKFPTNSTRQVGIFTRLAVERSDTKRFFQTLEGEEWLSLALETASKTSIASVRNLSRKPDVWFIFIDDTLPRFCVEQIKSVYSKISIPKVEVVKLKDWASTSTTVLSTGERFKDCEIQIRLDYDDMLHRNYLEILLQKTRGIEDTTILSPNIGIVLDKRFPKMAVIEKNLPPFLLLVRRSRDDEYNIFSFKHDSWPNQLVKKIDGEPIWLQSITGRNVANQFGRGWMVSRVRHLTQLDLSDWNGEQVIYRSPKIRTALLNSTEVIQELKMILTRNSYN